MGLVDFAERNLPALARLYGKECQDDTLYRFCDLNFWTDLNSDRLPQSSPEEKTAMALTMQALKFWQGFLQSPYKSMTEAKFQKVLEKERKALAKKESEAASGG